MENLLTIKDVAKQMSVCVRTVMRHIKAKKLRASKVGHWRIKQKDFDSFFNKNANKKN